MRRMKAFPVIAASLALVSCAMQTTTPSTPPVTAELRREFAPSGVLRSGTNFGNPVIAQKDPAGGGNHRGPGPTLARELARRLGVPIEYVVYDTAGKMADAVKAGAWDVAFLAVDPARARDIAFSEPYVLIEGTYMVRKESPLKRIEDFDRAGLRIAVATKSAYDLYLTREIRQATLVRYPTSQAAIDAFLKGETDAAAGVKQPLVATAKKDPNLRVIEGAFMSIGQASGVPRDRENAARFLRAFIEEQKASGLVRRALDESGNPDATVAPAAKAQS
jgi:polar amino acid transport system substrate-binding protein